MISQKISDDIKTAMKAREAEKLSTLRMLQSALKNEAINLKKPELDDAEAFKIIKTEIKRRNDSIESYQQGGRQDLADQEMREKGILEQYLPAQMSAEEIETRVSAIVDRIAAEEKSAPEGRDSASGGNFGALMGRVMKELGDSADGNLVRQALQKKLS